MKPVRSLAAMLLIIALVLLGSRIVAAQPQPQQYYGGGGMITGTVLGFDMYDQLQPIEWATIYASDGQRTFVAYSGNGGSYEMFVPVGTYNVTVTIPGYKPYSMSVAVSDGGTSNINFYLEESGVPIPEFQPSEFALMVFVALASVLLAKRAAKRRR